MDQNNLIAQLIPWYQKFISATEIIEEKAAAKLRPTAEAEPDDLDAQDELNEGDVELPEDGLEMEVEADEDKEFKTDSEPDEEPEFIN